MNKMRIFRRFAVIMTAMMLMVGAGIFMSKPIDVYASQTRTGEITENFAVGYPDAVGISRTLMFDVKCTYTAVWDEGYGGYIADAIFWDAMNAHEGNTSVTMTKVFLQSKPDGDYRYMKYRAGYVVITIYVDVDEWGDVDLWVKEVIIESYGEQY